MAIYTTSLPRRGKSDRVNAVSVSFSSIRLFEKPADFYSIIVQMLQYLCKQILVWSCVAQKTAYIDPQTSDLRSFKHFFLFAVFFDSQLTAVKDHRFSQTEWAYFGDGILGLASTDLEPCCYRSFKLDRILRYGFRRMIHIGWKFLSLIHHFETDSNNNYLTWTKGNRWSVRKRMKRKKTDGSASYRIVIVEKGTSSSSA